MSTNFYFRNKEEYAKHNEVNNKVLAKIANIIDEIRTIVDDEDEVRSIQWKLETAAYVGYEQIHIGKRSIGWKPSFECQEGLFRSVREMKDFYEKNDDKYEILSEYGVVLSWDELKEELLDWNGERENMHDAYKDEDGYIWHRYEFS